MDVSPSSWPVSIGYTLVQLGKHCSHCFQHRLVLTIIVLWWKSNAMETNYILWTLLYWASLTFRMLQRLLPAVFHCLAVSQCAHSSVDRHLRLIFRFVTVTSKAAKYLTLKKTDSFQSGPPYNMPAKNLWEITLLCILMNDWYCQFLNFNHCIVYGFVYRGTLNVLLFSN